MRRLEAFCKVVELGGFTKAAEVLGLSQPTVSEHIRNLEESLDEKLVDRLGREVRVTPAGEVFYHRALEILKLRDRALDDLDRFRGALSGNLTLAASTIPGAYILPTVIGSFKTKHPRVGIDLEIGGSAAIMEGVIEGAYEMGVIGWKGQDQRLETEEIFYDQLALAVWPEHPWAKRGVIEPKELLEEPFLLREKASGTGVVMENILKSKGIDLASLNVVARLGGTEAIKQAIKAKVGVSVISSLAIEEDIAHGRLKIVDIKDVSWNRTFYMAFRKGRQLGPVCEAFTQHLRVAGKDR